MAGRKLFLNNTGKQVKVTLFIRMGDSPANNAGNESFNLAPQQQNWLTYGNDSNVYLNGLSLLSVLNGEVDAEQHFVVQRGNNLNNEMNMNNVVQLLFNDGAFHIRTWNG